MVTSSVGLSWSFFFLLLVSSSESELLESARANASLASCSSSPVSDKSGHQLLEKKIHRHRENKLLGI